MAEGIIEGDGFSVGSLDAMGEGYGFRKVRRELGVTAFGVNALVLPPGYRGGAHYHDEQEELYICLRGKLALEFGPDGEETHVLEPGDMARVDAATIRRQVNPDPDADCTYLCVGGKDGYVGRDGRVPGGQDDGPRPGPGA